MRFSKILIIEIVYVLALHEDQRNLLYKDFLNLNLHTLVTLPHLENFKKIKNFRRVNVEKQDVIKGTYLLRES